MVFDMMVPGMGNAEKALLTVFIVGGLALAIGYWLSH
jgi:hypothetical protein